MATVAVTVWAVFFRDTTPVLAPDYAPQEDDKNAIDLNDKDTEKLEQSEGGGAVTLSFTKEIVVDLATNTAAMSFDNPAKSNQNMQIGLNLLSTTSSPKTPHLSSPIFTTSVMPIMSLPPMPTAPL